MRRARIGPVRHATSACIAVVRPALRAEEGRRVSDGQLRRVLVDSGTSILGLVQHPGRGGAVLVRPPPHRGRRDADREYDMTVPADRAAADVLRGYRATIEDSDRAIRAVGDPDARLAV